MSRAFETANEEARERGGKLHVEPHLFGRSTKTFLIPPGIGGVEISCERIIEAGHYLAAFAIQRVIIRTRALEMQARSAAQRPPELSCFDLAGVGEMPYAALTIYQEIQRYRGGLAAPKCIWRKRWNASRKAETWARRLMILTDGYAIAARRGKLEYGLARARACEPD